MSVLKIAHTNCERLVRLINDILDIPHMKGGTLEAHSEPVEVGPLVEEAIEANHGFAEKFGVAVRLEKGGKQGIVRADPDRLIQVVTNLLSNAVKLSPRGDEVIVAVEADETEVRISVRDHGPGIPESSRLPAKGWHESRPRHRQADRGPAWRQGRFRTGAGWWHDLQGNATAGRAATPRASRRGRSRSIRRGESPRGPGAGSPRVLIALIVHGRLDRPPPGRRLR